MTRRISAVLVGLSAFVLVLALALAGSASAEQLSTSLMYVAGPGQQLMCVATNVTNRDVEVWISVQNATGTVLSEESFTVPPLQTVTRSARPGQHVWCRFRVAYKNSIRANITMFNVLEGGGYGDSVIVLPAN
jgi:hypothetical protein